MDKYVSLDKRSKKAQKEYYSKRRRTWGDVNPVTRTVPSGKTYNRKKDKQKMRRTGKEFRDGFGAGSFYSTAAMTKNSCITLTHCSTLLVKRINRSSKTWESTHTIH